MAPKSFSTQKVRCWRCGRLMNAEYEEAMQHVCSGGQDFDKDDMIISVLLSVLYFQKRLISVLSPGLPNRQVTGRG